MTTLNDTAQAAVDRVKYRYELAAQIRAERERRGLSKGALASLLRVHQASIIGWERGDSAPAGKTLAKVEAWMAEPQPAEPMESVHVFASSFDDGGLVLVSHDQEDFEKMVRNFVTLETKELGLPVEDIPEDFDEMLDYWDGIAPAANTTAFEYQAGDKQLFAVMG